MLVTSPEPSRNFLGISNGVGIALDSKSLQKLKDDDSPELWTFTAVENPFVRETTLPPVRHSSSLA